MNEAIWLGNYIVPRWEAILLLGLSVVVLVAIGIAVLITAGYAAEWVWKRIRF